MAIQTTDLADAFRRGDQKRVAALFKKTSEAERRALFPFVAKWFKALWDKRRDREVPPALALELELPNEVGCEHLAAAQAAAFATANLKQLLPMLRLVWVWPSVGVAVLGDRKPAWTQDFADALCDVEWRHGMSGQWGLVRLLVRAGLCRAPRHDGYAVGMITGVWHSNPRNMVAALLADKDLLKEDVWRLFEVEGTTDVGLTTHDKWKGDGAWAVGLLTLSKRGEISRARLLDASLAALARDFAQLRAGWFSRFHEALKPTPNERVERLDAYLRLVGSSIPPTVTFALDAIVVADKLKPQPAKRLLPHFAPALTAKSGGAVKSALQLLDRIAAREAAARAECAHLAVNALLHDSPEVQQRAFDLIDRYGDHNDVKLRAAIMEHRTAVVPSLRKRLLPWSDAGKPASKATVPERKKSIPSRLDPARAIQPITGFDELLDRAAFVLENPGEVEEIERVLDAVVRLNRERPEDFAGRLAPMRKRAKGCLKQPYRGNNLIRKLLAAFFESWAGQDAQTLAFQALEEDVRDSHRFLAVLVERLRAVAVASKRDLPLPLLSAPTHRGGWIAPQELVRRAGQWQQAGAIPDQWDQKISLLRLAPEDRGAALMKAAALRGEYADALRHALGAEKVKVGPTAGLWVAAARARAPFADDEAVEKRHPKLGPDAGRAATWTWGVDDGGGFVTSTPVVPKKVPGELLPVLLYANGGYDDEPFWRWLAILCPSLREATFAYAGAELLGWTDQPSFDPTDGNHHVCLSALSDPHTPLRDMARFALAVGITAVRTEVVTSARDALVAAVEDGRLNTAEFGATLGRFMASRWARPARWAKVFKEVSRVSPMHEVAVAAIIERALRGDPTRAPRDLGALLALWHELRSGGGIGAMDNEARMYLAGLKSGQAAQLAAKLLANAGLD